MGKPILLIFAGPNGSGKSTITEKRKADINFTYINADEIKVKLNGTDKEAADVANAMMVECIKNRESFAMETVFSHPSKLELMREAKAEGYIIEFVFVTTYRSEINVDRVRDRVAKGGHDVPKEKIRARYERSMELLPEAISLADIASIYNNSLAHPICILTKDEKQINIYPQEKPSKWDQERLSEIKAKVIECGTIRDKMKFAKAECKTDIKDNSVKIINRNIDER